MTKHELARALVGIDKSVDTETASFVVDVILSTIKKAVKEGKRAEFRRFGTFLPHERVGYETINPVTRERIKIPSKKLMRFRAGVTLNKMINEHNAGDIVK